MGRPRKTTEPAATEVAEADPSTAEANQPPAKVRKPRSLSEPKKYRLEQAVSIDGFTYFQGVGEKEYADPESAWAHIVENSLVGTFRVTRIVKGDTRKSAITQSVSLT